MGLATLLPILGFAALFARLLRTTLSVAMLHAVSAIIVVLFIGGLAQVLWWVALGIHFAGVVLLGYEASRLRGTGQYRSISTPIAVLLSCVAVFWLIHSDSLYLYYDEYAHWGIFIKEMLALDGFWLADTNSMHPRYPPAAPLWQYLFNVFGEPSEPTAYLAQFVLLLTPLLVLWERLTWRQALWITLILALCLLALTNFGLGISSLYVDHVIGTWFLGTILCFVRDSPSLSRCVIYALPLTTLALLKESSIAFALAAAGVLGSLVWLRSWEQSRRLAPGAARASLVAIVVTLPAVLCLQAWEWRLDRIGAPADLEAVGRVVAGLDGDQGRVDTEHIEEITRRFLQVLRDQQLSNDQVSRQYHGFSYQIRDLFTDRYRLTTSGFFLLYAIWWLGLTIFVLGPERRKWGVVASGIGLVGVAFLLALYLTFRSAPGESGLFLSSYTRYVHTVALPMLLVSFAPLLPAFRSGPERAWQVGKRSVPANSVIACAACIGLYVFEPPYLQPIVNKNAVIELRTQLEPLTAAIHSAVGRSSMWVYLPNDDPNGFIGQLFHYLLTPTPVHVEREKRFLERSPEEVLKVWAKFEYVWLPVELSTETTTRFGEIAGVPLADRLFAVATDESGRARLNPVTSEM